MKHVKKFDEFLQDENPNTDPKKKPETGDAETTANAEAPKDEVPTAEKPEETPDAKGTEPSNTERPDEEPAEDPKGDDTETPASDAADDVNAEVEDDTEVDEGNKFSGAVAKAKEEGKTEFEFEGKTYKIKEGVSANAVADFESFLAENFQTYPSYNNMIGSEVLRNVPITHQVNLAVYGKENVVDQVLPGNETTEQ
jgi:hypothetical protein